MSQFEIVERKVIEIDDDYMTAARVKAAYLMTEQGEADVDGDRQMVEPPVGNENGKLIDYSIVAINDVAVRKLG